MIATAKTFEPRGTRKQYIPGWSEKIERLFKDYVKSGRLLMTYFFLWTKLENKSGAIPSRLLILNTQGEKLGSYFGNASPPLRSSSQVTAYQIVSHMVKMSQATADKTYSTIIRKELRILKK